MFVIGASIADCKKAEGIFSIVLDHSRETYPANPALD